MYSAKSVNGLPYWEFAYWLCQQLNKLDDNSELFLNEFDQNWLKALDHAFTKEVQHA
jgi:hypothetical protein